jgi:DNA-binding Lrp family transcriptional regulator
MDDVLECHHVTGEHTLLLKVKTNNTASLESLISTIRFIEGVSRTETMVVLSTHIERVTVALPEVEEEEEEGGEAANSRRLRHNGARSGLSHTKRA